MSEFMIVNDNDKTSDINVIGDYVKKKKIIFLKN
jgi:hypothetical protein